MNIKEAKDEIEAINKRNENANLKLAAEMLGSMSKLLGDSCELNGELLERVEEGHNRYNTIISDANEKKNDFNKWCKDLYKEVLNFEGNLISVSKAQENGKKFIKKQASKRKKIIKGVMIFVVIISIGFAAVSICGTINEFEWADTLAACLGTIDFAVGVLGFSWERISDMKSQEVGHSLAEMEEAQTKDLSKAVEIAGNINIATGNKVYQDNSKTGINFGKTYKNQGDVYVSK
jgi:hypothetical protein